MGHVAEAIHTPQPSRQMCQKRKDKKQKSKTMPLLASGEGKYYTGMPRKADVSPRVNLACVMPAESCIQVQDCSIRRSELVNKRVASQGTTGSRNLQRACFSCTEKSSIAH